jgi:hypothetical protein
MLIRISQKHSIQGARMYEITMICLANSRKPPSGRCIAGKEFAGNKVGKWLRPVSARPGHEVSEDERRYESGIKAQLLDILSVPLIRAAPFDHQVENHVLDDKFYWTKTGTADWNRVVSCVDAFDPAFWGNSQSTYHGQNDKVAEANVIKTGSSLKLILVSDLEVVVHVEDGYQGAQGRRRVRGRFTLNHAPYLMSITDPEMEEAYLVRGDGKYQVGNAALCISLVEIWNGFAFRVIASLITPQRCA